MRLPRAHLRSLLNTLSPIAPHTLRQLMQGVKQTFGSVRSAGHEMGRAQMATQREGVFAESSTPPPAWRLLLRLYHATAASAVAAALRARGAGDARGRPDPSCLIQLLLLDHEKVRYLY